MTGLIGFDHLLRLSLGIEEVKDHLLDTHFGETEEDFPPLTLDVLKADHLGSLRDIDNILLTVNLLLHVGLVLVGSGLAEVADARIRPLSCTILEPELHILRDLCRITSRSRNDPDAYALGETIHVDHQIVSGTYRLTPHGVKEVVSTSIYSILKGTLRGFLSICREPLVSDRACR